MSRLGRVLPCTLLLWSVAAQSQTLQDTLQLALAHHADARLATLNIQAQQAERAYAQAQTGWQLAATGEVGLGRIDTGGAVFPVEGGRQLKSFGLQLSKPLYTAGRDDTRIAIADASIAQAEANQRQTNMQVRLLVIAIHSALSRDKAIIQLEQDTQAALDRAVSDANKRLKAGEVTRTDVAQAQARQALGVASQSRAQAALLIDQARYQALTGAEPVDIPTLLPTLTDMPSLDTLINALEQSPALDAARQAVEVAKRHVHLTTLGLKPSVQLTGHAVNQQDTDFSRDRIQSYGLSVQANWPLLDGGSNSAEQQRAYAQLALAEAKLDATRDQQLQNLRTDYAQWRTSQDQEPALRQAKDAAELALNTIRRELELGTRTTYDLLTAERDLLDARTQCVLNQEEQAVRGYQVLADAGLLTDFDPIRTPESAAVLPH